MLRELRVMVTVARLSCVFPLSSAHCSNETERSQRGEVGMPPCPRRVCCIRQEGRTPGPPL